MGIGAVELGALVRGCGEKRLKAAWAEARVKAALLLLGRISSGVGSIGRTRHAALGSGRAGRAGVEGSGVLGRAWQARLACLVAAW